MFLKLDVFLNIFHFEFSKLKFVCCLIHPWTFWCFCLSQHLAKFQTCHLTEFFWIFFWTEFWMVELVDFCSNWGEGWCPTYSPMLPLAVCALDAPGFDQGERKERGNRRPREEGRHGRESTAPPPNHATVAMPRVQRLSSPPCSSAGTPLPP